jgi:hypothetical protein
MRLRGLLLVGAFALAAGSSPGAAQLPPPPSLPPLPPLPSVPDTAKKVEEDVKKVVEDVKKAVDDNAPAPGGPVGGPAPAPGGGGPGSGGGSDGPKRGGPAGSGQERDGAAAVRGAGGASAISHDCPGEGLLGGGAKKPPATPTGAVLAGGLPTGEGALGVATGSQSGGVTGALSDAAAFAGPLVLAVFALGALLLLVGLGGGLRALKGRLSG